MKENFQSLPKDLRGEWMDQLKNELPDTGKTVASLNPFSASDLEKEPVEEVSFVLDGIMSKGLGLLSAPPKYGKSFFALQLALSVARGDRFIGRSTKKTDVLYLALEDSKARLKQRTGQLLLGNPFPDNLFFLLEIQPLGQGFEDLMYEYLDRNRNIGLVVIDTLRYVRSRSTSRQSAYDADYADMQKLKRLADSFGITILLIHHSRKMNDPSDVFSNISGTFGIMGGLDFCMVMTKEERSSDETALHITGRDSLPDEIVLSMKEGRWSCLGSVDVLEELKAEARYRGDPVVSTILKLVGQTGSWTGTSGELISASKYTNTHIFDSATAVTKKISSLSEQLFARDRVIYEPAKTGTAGRIHKFKKAIV